MIRIKDLLIEGQLKWKRVKVPGENIIEYRAEAKGGNTFVIGRGGTTKRVAHPLTKVMRTVPVKYWVARMEDEKGRTSPKFYDSKSSTLAKAKKKVQRFAEHEGLI